MLVALGLRILMRGTTTERDSLNSERDSRARGDQLQVVAVSCQKQSGHGDSKRHKVGMGIWCVSGFVVTGRNPCLYLINQTQEFTSTGIPQRYVLI